MAASSGDGGGGAWSTASVRSRRAAPPVPAPRRGGGDDSSPGAGELTEAVEGLEDRKRWLDEYDIPVEASGEGAPVPLAPADGYEAAGLAEAVLRNAASCGYEGPSPVQCYATPIVMGGRDLMACAHTGSGKTTALCLPVVSDLVAAAGGYRRRDTESFDRKAKPRALVLAPTRAAQVKAGGDINGKGSVAFTLWNEGSTYFISLLLKAGADPNLSDDELRRVRRSRTTTTTALTRTKTFAQVKDTASNANSNRSLSKLKMDDDKGALLDAYQMLIRCYRKAAAHMLLKAKDIIEFGPFDEMYAKRLVKDCDPNTALPCDEGEEGYAVCFDGPLKVGKPDFSMTVNGKNLEGLLVSKMVGAGRKRKRKNNTAVHEPMVPPQPPSRVRQAKREKRPNLRRRVTLHTNTRVPPDTIRRIKYGTRSRMDAKAWTCKGCGQVNRPARYIIADLPPLRCINKKCNKPLPDDYEFSFTMARACVNGSCPIGNIKDQEQTDECSLYNTCGALEITERMAKLLVGEVPCGKDAEGPILSTKDLLAKFEEMMRLHDINTGWGDNKFNITTLLAACDIAVLEGIKHLDDHEAVPRVHKASGKRRVPCRFSEIAKKLANGTPLIGVINTGKKFGDLKNGHIYKAPPNKDVPGKRTGYHCIVLIGAGKRRKCYFYHFLNSYGELFCLRIRETKKRSLKISRGGIHKGKVKKFVGGFGKVRADDLLEEPVEFLRYPDSSVTNELWVPRRDLDAGNIDDLIMNVNFCSEWTRRMDARTS